jgi:hypothetical protein
VNKATVAGSEERNEDYALGRKFSFFSKTEDYDSEASRSNRGLNLNNPRKHSVYFSEARRRDSQYSRIYRSGEIQYQQGSLQ